MATLMLGSHYLGTVMVTISLKPQRSPSALTPALSTMMQTVEKSSSNPRGITNNTNHNHLTSEISLKRMDASVHLPHL